MIGTMIDLSMSLKRLWLGAQTSLCDCVVPDRYLFFVVGFLIKVQSLSLLWIDCLTSE